MIAKRFIYIFLVVMLLPLEKPFLKEISFFAQDKLSPLSVFKAEDRSTSEAFWQREGARVPKNTKLLILDWDKTISYFQERETNFLLEHFIATGELDVSATLEDAHNLDLQKQLQGIISDKLRKEREDLYTQMRLKVYSEPEDIYTDSRMVPGAIKLIKMVKSLKPNLKIIVVTGNRKKAVEGQAELFGIQDLFDDIRSALDEGDFGKKKIMSEIKGDLKAEEVVSIDDSYGTFDASSLGIPTVAIDAGTVSRDFLEGMSADYIIKDFVTAGIGKMAALILGEEISGSVTTIPVEEIFFSSESTSVLDSQVFYNILHASA